MPVIKLLLRLKTYSINDLECIHNFIFLKITHLTYLSPIVLCQIKRNMFFLNRELLGLVHVIHYNFLIIQYSKKVLMV